MWSKSDFIKYIKTGAVCILAIACILLPPLNNSVTSTASVTKPTAAQNTVLPADGTPKPSAGESTINIYTCDSQMQDIFSKYAKDHPEFKYKINFIEDACGSYFREVVNDLEKGGNAIDVYCVPGSYAREFIKGGYSRFACTYKDLGIDVDTALKKADIPQYAIEAGTNPDGEIVTLPYESDIGVFMYRRSIAREVWGTDDPGKIADILGAGTEGWDKFIKAAKTLKEHGCYIVPGCSDLWPLVETRLKEYPDIDPEWKKFMDVSKYLLDNGCMKEPIQYSEEWFNDLDGKGDKPIFGLVPCHFYEWEWNLSNTAGDWAVCQPPVSSIDLSGNTAILVNKNSPLKDKIKPLIEWISLDSSETGLQYCLANDDLRHENNDFYGLKRPVVSGTVLKNSNGGIDFLGGQNINTVFYDVQRATAKQQGYGSLNNTNSNTWLLETEAYLRGEKNKKTATADFLKEVNSSLEYLDTYYFDPAVNTAINIYTEDDELIKIINKYAEKHPEFKYKIHGHVGSLIDDNNFLSQIADPMKKGDGSAIDIYSVPAMYAKEFIKGKYSGYACTYKELGIDVDTAIKKADIPQYAIDAGTNPNGDIIALPYETGVSVFMYRRSVARRVWGTDDPDKIAGIIGAGTGKWDKFTEAAQTLERHGYCMTPGCYGIWPAFEDATDASGNGLNENDISPNWEEFMDVSKNLFDNGCLEDAEPYTDQWYNYLDGKGDKPVFGLITTDNFITSGTYERYLKSTAGDWAVCLPPDCGLNKGVHSGIMVSKDSLLKNDIGPLIEWITLDCSGTGLQHCLANDTLYRNDKKNNDLYKTYGGKRFVISGTIMKNTNNSLGFLGGQNINPILCNVTKQIDNKRFQFYTSLENAFATEWINVTRAYLKGNKTKEAVIAEFRAEMKDIREKHSEYLNIIYKD